MLITPAYAALFGLFFIFLSVRTLRLRRKLGVPLGNGEHPKMLRAMRVHSNFAEYVPLALLLIYFGEVQGGLEFMVHALCITLLIGRAIHAYGVSQVDENYNYRVAGMALTFFTIVSAALRIFAGYGLSLF